MEKTILTHIYDTMEAYKAQDEALIQQITNIGKDTVANHSDLEMVHADLRELILDIDESRNRAIAETLDIHAELSEARFLLLTNALTTAGVFTESTLNDLLAANDELKQIVNPEGETLND